ncbi:12203_t:CDS:1 [Dentiscutata heterogama]|uniref:12203_t:CDS:1 n=1 Tax=Dentiscutata heterogama TaxID=1316150 RepID=A0ACA9LYW1_9GLOM|nr:12203_t:CDS:1 [Dentiscutata heterogama]
MPSSINVARLSSEIRLLSKFQRLHPSLEVSPFIGSFVFCRRLRLSPGVSPFDRNFSLRRGYRVSPSGSAENYPRIQRQRPGDWICKSCGINNFAYRTECFECGEKVQNREVAPGDWICPKCEFYNFQSRLACFKCHTPAPNFEQNPNKDHQEN